MIYFNEKLKWIRFKLYFTSFTFISRDFCFSIMDAMHANKIMFHAKQYKAVKCKNIIFRTKYFNILHFSFLQMFLTFFSLQSCQFQESFGGTFQTEEWRKRNEWKIHNRDLFETVSGLDEKGNYEFLMLKRQSKNCYICCYYW